MVFLKKAIPFMFAGIGEGGSRIVLEFTRKKYVSVIINTSKTDSDLLDLKNSSKLVIDSGLGGAGKDCHLGETIIAENQELVREFFKSRIIASNDTFSSAGFWRPTRRAVPSAW